MFPSQLILVLFLEFCSDELIFFDEKKVADVETPLLPERQMPPETNFSPALSRLRSAGRVCCYSCVTLIDLTQRLFSLLQKVLLQKKVLGSEFYSITYLNILFLNFFVSKTLVYIDCLQWSQFQSQTTQALISLISWTSTW